MTDKKIRELAEKTVSKIIDKIVAPIRFEVEVQKIVVQLKGIK